MRLTTIFVFCIIFLGTCSLKPDVDPTLEVPTVRFGSRALLGSTEETIFTTTEVPVSVPCITLKKVSVKQDKGGFLFTAFVEEDQQEKITKKGQEVDLLVVNYYGSSHGSRRILIIAKAK